MRWDDTQGLLKDKELQGDGPLATIPVTGASKVTHPKIFIDLCLCFACKRTPDYSVNPACIGESVFCFSDSRWKVELSSAPPGVLNAVKVEKQQQQQQQQFCFLLFS